MKVIAIAATLLFTNAWAQTPDMNAASKDTQNLPVPNINPTGAAAAPEVKKGSKTVSGIVNVLRQGSNVEVVMKGGDIYMLPKSSRQASMFKLLKESETSGKPVSFTVNEKSGLIDSVGESSGGGAGSNQSK